MSTVRTTSSTYGDTAGESRDHAASGRRGKQLRPSTIHAAYNLRACMLVLPVDGLMLLAPIIWMPEHLKAFVLMTIVGLILLRGAAPYRARLHLSVLDELPILITRLFVGGAIVATAFALQHQKDEVATFLATALISFALVVLGRFITTQILLWGRQNRFVRHPTVIVGGGDVAREIAVVLQRYPRYGLDVVGFVDEAQDGDTLMPIPCLGRLTGLSDVVRGRLVDVVLIADGDLSNCNLDRLVGRPEIGETDLLVIPRFRHAHIQVGHVDHIGSVPVMRLTMPVLQHGKIAKRVLDIVVSVALLTVLSPVLAVVALVVRLDGPGILFRQERVGQHGEHFSCLKFRTMRPCQPGQSATEWSPRRGRESSRAARFLRRTSLDELPQLWNVLRGDMTLVGPRPERPYFVDKFSAEHPRYSARHRVRVGLTGLAQVSGLRGDTPISDRARFDNYYIENWSLWLDIKVLLRTIGEMIFLRGR